MNTAQMFKLIDSVLFFEACLYHQVLPLALENNRLLLGMVNPEDTSSLEYINRILSHMNCSLVPLPMAADTHRELLSAYLSYREKSKPASTPTPDTQPTPPTATKQPNPKKTRDNIHDRPTLILTETETLKSSEPESSEPLPSLEQPKSIDPVSTEAVLQTNSNLLVLNVEAPHYFSPIEVLTELPPKELLQELLARVLAEGIGRLYFERQPLSKGKILWSQNGILQSTLEVSLTTFQQTINELKRFTDLPSTPVKVKTLVEVYCLYQKNRLLLRLQVLPGESGEQATLQVLRGAALKFYQQQQLSHLSRDALLIARQLLGKVNELQKRAQLNTRLNSEELDLPEDLNRLLASLSEINESAQAAVSPKENNENNLS